MFYNKYQVPFYLWRIGSALKPYYVGNKAKGRISKRLFQENKARQIFRKSNISYPLIRTRNVLRYAPVLRFALLPYNRQLQSCKILSHKLYECLFFARKFEVFLISHFYLCLQETNLLYIYIKGSKNDLKL